MVDIKVHPFDNTTDEIDSFKVHFILYSEPLVTIL
jgi:hypothetical protein